MNNPTQAWQAMVAAALLGTDRAEAGPGLSGELATVTSNEKSADAVLLGNAAALTVYLRAGVEPVAGEASSSNVASPAGDRFVSAAAGEHLEAILLNNRAALLAEWCELAGRGGYVAPAHLLPELLRRAEHDFKARGLLQAVLGQRGQWLMEQNPQWSKLFVVALQADPNDAWQTGTADQRVQLLQSLRATDANAARALIESTWEQDSPEDRARFVQAMQIGLCAGDEPLLERALDDRRKPVRDAAGECLARLPVSQFAQRMIARLSGAISYQPAAKGLLRKKAAQISVMLPPEPDAAAKRDGLVAKAIGGMGPQAAMLADIIAATPLAFWDRFDAKPNELIEAAMMGEYALALISGWRRAAIRQTSRSWAQALLWGLLNAKPAQQIELLPAEEIEALMKVLSRDQAEAAVLEAMDKKGGRGFEMLRACSFAWSMKLSGAALSFVRHSNIQADYLLRQWLMDSAATRIDPAILQEAQSGWPDDLPPASRQAVDQFLQALQFRHDMHKELLS